MVTGFPEGREQQRSTETERFMNSKNNLRFQQTEGKIREIFLELLKKKVLSKITVREICSLAHINRTTFYLHHEGIYELMQCIESDMYRYFKGIFTSPGKNYCLRERFLHLFSFIKKHQDFYRIYLSSQRKPSIFDYTLLPESDIRIQKFLSQSRIDNALEYEYCQTFFLAGLTAFIQKWLNSGCMESEEELLQLLTRQFSFSQQLLLLLY